MRSVGVDGPLFLDMGPALPPHVGHDVVAERAAAEGPAGQASIRTDVEGPGGLAILWASAVMHPIQGIH